MLDYKLSVDKISLKDDNDPEAKQKISDIKVKSLLLEDVDPDSFEQKMKALEMNPDTKKQVLKNADNT